MMESHWCRTLNTWVQRWSKCNAVLVYYVKTLLPKSLTSFNICRVLFISSKVWFTTKAKRTISCLIRPWLVPNSRNVSLTSFTSFAVAVPNKKWLLFPMRSNSLRFWRCRESISLPPCHQRFRLFSFCSIWSNLCIHSRLCIQFPLLTFCRGLIVFLVMYSSNSVGTTGSLSVMTKV